LDGIIAQLSFLATLFTLSATISIGDFVDVFFVAVFVLVEVFLIGLGFRFLSVFCVVISSLVAIVFHFQVAQDDFLRFPKGSGLVIHH
jgi:hypothetical protein